MIRFGNDVYKIGVFKKMLRGMSEVGVCDSIYIYADLYSFKVSGKKEKPILLLVKSSALHKIP